jgi:hypothetical protein
MLQVNVSLLWARSVNRRLARQSADRARVPDLSVSDLDRLVGWTAPLGCGTYCMQRGWPRPRVTSSRTHVARRSSAAAARKAAIFVAAALIALAVPDLTPIVRTISF